MKSLKNPFAILVFIMTISALAKAQPPIFHEVYNLHGHNGSDTSEILPIIPRTTSLAWSPNEKYLAAGDVNGWLHIWEMDNGQKIVLQQIHEDATALLKWSEDSRFLAAASGALILGKEDPTIWLWDAVTKETSILQSHTGFINNIAWLNDNRLISVSNDGTMRAWNPQSKTSQLISDLIWASLYRNHFAISPDESYLAAVDWEQTLHIWETKNFSLVTSVNLEGNFRPVEMAWSGNYIAVSAPKVTKIIDVTTQTTAYSATQYNLVVWSPNSQYFALINQIEAKVIIIETETMLEVGSLAGTYATWRSDSQMIISDNGLIWNSKTGLVSNLPTPSALDEISGAGFIWIGEMIIGNLNEHLIAWYGANFAEISVIDKADSSIRRLAVSPNGNYLVRGDSAGNIKIWSISL